MNRHRMSSVAPGVESGVAVTERILACPCNKFNRISFRRCRSHRGFRSVADIRTHLGRAHMQPLFCPTCKTVFTGDQAAMDREQHILEPPPGCIYSGAPDPAGITRDQRDQMAAVAARRRGRSSIQECWVEIWNILFPGYHPPASIYHECSEFSEDLGDALVDLETNRLQGVMNDVASQTEDARYWFWSGATSIITLLRQRYNVPIVAIYQAPQEPEMDANTGIADGLVN